MKQRKNVQSFPERCLEFLIYFPLSIEFSMLHYHGEKNANFDAKIKCYLKKDCAIKNSRFNLGWKKYCINHRFGSFNQFSGWVIVVVGVVAFCLVLLMDYSLYIFKNTTQWLQFHHFPDQFNIRKVHRSNFKWKTPMSNREWYTQHWSRIFAVVLFRQSVLCFLLLFCLSKVGWSRGKSDRQHFIWQQQQPT